MIRPCSHTDESILPPDVEPDARPCKSCGRLTEPSLKGSILFLIAPHDADYKPIIIGHDGYFIHEEIQMIGADEVAELIAMPKDEELLKAGFYVWEGEVDWEQWGGGYESPPDYELTLEKGAIRRATIHDLHDSNEGPLLAECPHACCDERQ